MQRGELWLGACALLSVCVTACTTSGNLPSTPGVDASADADSSTTALDAAVQPDTFVPPSDDAGATPADAGIADAAPEAATCGWDGSYESPACATCLRSKCCAAVTSCEGDPDCVALDQCVDTCLTTGGDDAGSIATCAQECSDIRAPAVRSEWQALSNCLEFQCYNGGAGPCQ